MVGGGIAERIWPWGACAPDGQTGALRSAGGGGGGAWGIWCIGGPCGVPYAAGLTGMPFEGVALVGGPYGGLTGMPLEGVVP